MSSNPDDYIEDELNSVPISQKFTDLIWIKIGNEWIQKLDHLRNKT